MNKIIEQLQNKNIIILGFGMEGKSTYNYIRKYLKDIKLTIMDSNYQNITLDDKNVEIIDIDYNKFNNYDLIFKSPGISFKDLDTTSFKDKITSQLEIFLETTPSYTIGITGSKGKSTTTSLIYKIINDQNIKSYIVGNIGKPILDIVDEVDENTYVVIECSSHQLEYTKVSPNIGIILNLFEEHLDHYKSKEHYYIAKMNLVNYQSNKDYFIYSSDNEDLKNHIDIINTNATKLDINNIKNNNSYTYIKDNYIYVNDKKLYDVNTKRKIQGIHNLKNIMFTLTVSEILKLDINKTIESISNFEPLPHRMELVGTYNEITYYNDSIATIPNATINGIEALSNVNTIIIGGKDRGIDYSLLKDYLINSEIENIICLPDTGYTIGKEITNKNVHYVKTVEEAVDIAREVTKKNTICLLSPAASSYGFYKNFEERGNRFKEYIRKEENK